MDLHQLTKQGEQHIRQTASLLPCGALMRLTVRDGASGAEAYWVWACQLPADDHWLHQSAQPLQDVAPTTARPDTCRSPACQDRPVWAVG